MKMKKLFYICILFVMLPLNAVFAVTVPSLYSVTLPVLAQSDEAREAAVQAGFVQVMIRLTGNLHIGDNEVIKENAKRADYFVQEFSYSPATTTSSEYYIQIYYNKEDINRLLRRANLPYWGENRPLILVWLAVTNLDNHTADLIGNGTQSIFLNAIQQQSRQYGLPLIIPMLDMTDIDHVSFNDVAAMSLPVLKQAARRYEPEVLLIGRIQESNDSIQSQWELVLQDSRYSWTVGNSSAENVIAATMGQVNQILTERGMGKTRRNS